MDGRSYGRAVYEELIDTKCPRCGQRIRPVSYETAGIDTTESRKVVNIECGCLDPAWKRCERTNPVRTPR